MAYPETIYATNDLDGVHFKAPVPVNSALTLLRGHELVPSTSPELKLKVARSGIRAGTSAVWNRLWYSRPFTSESRMLLEMFRDAGRAHHRDIKIAMLSGREVELHAMTKKRLSDRYGDLIDGYYLNESTSASGWKETVVKALVASGNSVVHIDDDLKPAIRVARVNEGYHDPRVLVYLVRNLSNRPWLLNRGGIMLPDNVVPVSTLREAGTDFTRRLRKKEF
jgi:hypothetical protein